jgi:hypothetical protein
MRIRLIAYGILVLLLAIILVANWNLLSGAAEINLLIGRLHAPVFVLLLLTALLVAAIEAPAQALARRAWLAERRALAQQIEQLRQRADHVEGARLLTLESTLERELTAIRAQLDRLEQARLLN